ncbi:HAMP domain-containing protein [Paraburkholderia sediminicola]|uniref:HAMP domain-containing protein n=1 Tax=Paraburkholderia sediminicola TaxID=458836 RepID=UPI001414EEC1
MVSLRRAIVGPLGDALDYFQSIAAGDLTRTVQMRNRNETGMLRVGLASMQEKLRVKHKYFHVEGHRTWAFTARTKDRGVIRLFRATMIPIVRHVKIRGQANPFDPAWSPYFARRRTATDG